MEGPREKQEVALKVCNLFPSGSVAFSNFRDLA